MFQLERILVPVDFSDASLIAASHAGELARRFHSQVTLLHVNELLVVHPLSGPLGFGITSWEAVRAEHLAARRKQLDQFGAAELAGVAVRRMVCSGDPAKLIVERAREENPGLIVMSTHGGGLFRRFLIGSVTAKVLHDAECPIWTSAHLEQAPALAPGGIRHVMCAVNFGPQCLKAVRWAADFAAELDARFTVVHAVQETPPNLPERYMFQWHEEAHWGSGERLRTLLLDLGIEAETLVVSDGDVAKALTTVAKEKGAGVFVIGRSCNGNVPKRLGSHTYAIVCNTPCPVVSI